MNVARAYARTQNETASKERLMVLLFEAGLRHLRAGSAAFDAGKRSVAVRSLGKASDIVQELLATLKPEVFPELCDRLASIYMFVLSRIDRSLLTMTAKPAQDAARAFEPIVLGFAEAVAKLERGEAQRP